METASLDGPRVRSRLDVLGVRLGSIMVERRRLVVKRGGRKVAGSEPAVILGKWRPSRRTGEAKK